MKWTHEYRSGMRNKHRNVGFVLKINSNLCRQRGRLRVAQGQLFITGTHSLQWRHMSAMVSQITRHVVLDYSDWQKRKYQSPALLTRRVNMCACVCVVAVRIHRWPVDSTHKEPVKCFHVMTSSSPLCKRYFRILWITSIFDMCHNGCGACQIWTQWCAVITRFGIAWYCIHHCSGWSRI